MRRCALCLVDYPDALEFCPSDGSKLPPVRGETKALYDPLIGSTIDGRYLVDAVIGEGGMGLVYSGRHAIIDKRVAIKVLRKEAAADESSAHRFLAEAKAASKIGQRNIVDINDFGVLPDGHAYFVMEFLDGVTLGRIVSKHGPMAPAAVVSFAIQAARGLTAAHEKGIIHRDLKPENIFLLDRDGIKDFVKIVDFGIARDASSKKRLTVAGMVMGTPEYMAPEQASGQETDHRVDQYALACIMYESLTGGVPFSGDNAMQTLTKHVFEAVQPPSVRRPDLHIPPPLEAIIMKSLEKKRDDRYADMEAMMRAMQAIEPELQTGTMAVPPALRAAGAAVPTPASAPVTESAGLVAPARRSRVPLVVAAGVLAAVGAVVAATRPSRHHDSRSDSRTAERPVVATPTPPVVAPPPAANITLALRSIPTGADVYLGDEKLGVTPTVATRPRREDMLHLVFKHSGFKDGSRDVLGSENAQLVVTLAHESGVPPVVPAHPAGTQAGQPRPPAPGTLPRPPEPATAPVAVPATTISDPAPRVDKPDKPDKKKPGKQTDLRNPFGE